eukprot:TRINITY_DN106037_c0_g1_i1.p1 TRINITY_DN106037_c0_g1~~TRINITY_DN106037_c0_g1_i1.p1  ORF type:complete len:173 (+),score=79.35 TRINITY_DN106037_c0_g1_i1:33-521(+)
MNGNGDGKQTQASTTSAASSSSSSSSSAAASSSSASSTVRDPIKAAAAADGVKEIDVEALATFMNNLDSVHPTIPRQVIDYYMQETGCNSSDPKLKKLIAMVAQKFIFDVAHQAREHALIAKSSRNKDTRTLTTKHLTAALQEQGVRVVKPDFFADDPIELD